jgi:hypothetical protein
VGAAGGRHRELGTDAAGGVGDGTRVGLADALALTLLLASEQGNLFDKAAARWVGRFALEVPGLPLESAQLALSALSAVGKGTTAGAQAVAELLDEVGRSEPGRGCRAVARSVDRLEAALPVRGCHP